MRFFFLRDLYRYSLQRNLLDRNAHVLHEVQEFFWASKWYVLN